VAQDALLTRIEADLAWLDRCEDLLRRGELEPRATNGGTATDPVPHAGRRGRRPSPEERR
jgi:hypothetical protein